MATYKQFICSCGFGTDDKDIALRHFMGQDLKLHSIKNWDVYPRTASRPTFQYKAQSSSSWKISMPNEPNTDTNGKSNSQRLKHALDCKSALAIMQFDKDCPLCKIVAKVIYLKRKTVAAGCSPEEESAALAIADSLIDKYKLKRGDVYDRLYPPPTKEQFVEPETSHGHKIVSSGGNAHVYGYRSRSRKDMSF
jgi:hypothetical protein